MVITISCGTNSYDIKTSSENTIVDTLRILEEKGMIMDENGIPEKIYSVRKKKNISTNATYRECGIYQGDILRLKEQGAV